MKSREMMAGAVLAASLFFSLSARAQDQGGSLQGTVTDERGRGIAGAVVTVSGPDLQGTQTGVTDLSGQ